MNLKELIVFGMENSQEPVIKNPVLRAALEEPGSMVGTPTKEVTQYGRRIYDTPGGEQVSEKSTTFYFNGKWLNVPSIHEGRAFTDDQLRRMIKQGQIQPTSVHGSRIEAEEAAASRSNMMKSHTKGFAGGGDVIGKPGGLVEPGVMYYAKKKKAYHHGTNRPKGYIPASEYAKKHGFKFTEQEWLLKRGQPHTSGNTLNTILAGPETLSTGQKNITRKYFFEKLKPVKVGGHFYVKADTPAKDLFKYLDKEVLNNTTVEAIGKILKNEKVNKLFQAGDYAGLKLALKEVKGVTDAQRANGLLRISQLMSGTTFRNEMPKVELNKVNAKKLFKGLENESGFGLYKNMWKKHKSDVISKSLGEGYATKSYDAFVNDARNAIAESLNISREKLGKFKVDINELTGLSSAYNNKTFSSSQFINLMDSELNRQGHRILLRGYGDHEAKLQRALKANNPSEARQVIKDWKTWKDDWFHGKGKFKGLDKKFRTKEVQDILPDFILGDDASKIYTQKRLKDFQKLNFPIAEEIKNFGYAKTVGATKKARSEQVLLKEVAAGDKKAVDFITKALAKQKVPKDQRGFIATAMVEDFAKMGLKGGKLLRWLQLEYDVAFESLIYDYHRRYKGHEPGLAREALFLPKLIAKWIPEAKKIPLIGGLFEPYEGGVFEGPDEVLEKRLSEIKGTEKENLGKIIGEKKLVKSYIDNNKRMEELSDEWHRLEDAKSETIRYGQEWDMDMTPNVKEIEKQQKEVEDKFAALEKLNSPDSLTGYHTAYQAAKEKQDTEYGVKEAEAHKKRVETLGGQERFEKEREKKRHEAYLEYKGGKERSFYLPKGKLKERVEDPLYKKPYTFLETENTPYDIWAPGSKFWDYHDLTDKHVGPAISREGNKEKWKQIYKMGGIDLMDRIGIAGGVSKMAEGGIMSLKKK